ncbi:MAG: hypothetical protein KDA50_05500 [Rhodobacteraceae bacterium]|nr:hypothetical protein [Paracoccaceae bacterium]
MIPLHWLMRMSNWARRPPSWAQVRVVALILGICALLYGIEQVFGWPEWLTPDRGVGRHGVLAIPH